MNFVKYVASISDHYLSSFPKCGQIENISNEILVIIKYSNCTINAAFLPQHSDDVSDFSNK